MRICESNYSADPKLTEDCAVRGIPRCSRNNERRRNNGDHGWWSDRFPIPVPLHHRQEEGKKIWVVLRKKGEVGRRRLIFSFHFSLSYSDLISNKFNKFLWVRSGFRVTVIAEWSLPIPYPSHNPFFIATTFLYIFSPVQLRRAVMQQLWWVPSIQPGSTPARRHTRIPWAACPAAFSNSDVCLLCPWQFLPACFQGAPGSGNSGNVTHRWNF